jgi:hypothetical protein
MQAALFRSALSPLTETIRRDGASHCREPGAEMFPVKSGYDTDEVPDVMGVFMVASL